MNKTTLYRHFDKYGMLLYVGISNDPDRRIKEHKEKKWYRYIHKIKIKEYKSRDKALELEEKAIKKELPIYNTIHNKTNTKSHFKYLIFRLLCKIERLLYISLFIYLIIPNTFLS